MTVETRRWAGLGSEVPRHVAKVSEANLRAYAADNRYDRIVDVRPANSHASPAGANVIDLGAATVLPGLIDTHTHIFLQGEDPAAGGYDAATMAEDLRGRSAGSGRSAHRAACREVGAGPARPGVARPVCAGCARLPLRWPWHLQNCNG